jgi:hypothetical protein
VCTGGVLSDGKRDVAKGDALAAAGITLKEDQLVSCGSERSCQGTLIAHSLCWSAHVEQGESRPGGPLNDYLSLELREALVRPLLAFEELKLPSYVSCKALSTSQALSLATMGPACHGLFAWRKKADEQSDEADRDEAYAEASRNCPEARVWSSLEDEDPVAAGEGTSDRR